MSPSRADGGPAVGAGLPTAGTGPPSAGAGRTSAGAGREPDGAGRAGGGAGGPDQSASPDQSAPPDQPVSRAARAVADAHRREWAFVLAATARVAGDIDLAEECVQDAYVSALDDWARQGVPRNPGAWLTTTARRRAIDLHRRDQTLRRKLPLLVEPAPPEPAGPASGERGDDVIADDRLRLIFTCCHPALGREAQVALTLRLVCGLATTEIAQAFLVPEATMAARVTRAKKKISGARIPYRVPGPAELPDRLDAVLTVVHLLFTTGHTAPAGGDLIRRDLVERSLDLARMLRALLPSDPGVAGLLALILLTDARRDTRVDGEGRMVLLPDQDRGRWDRAAIGEGVALVREALRHRPPGRPPGHRPTASPARRGLRPKPPRRGLARCMPAGRYQLPVRDRCPPGRRCPGRRCPGRR
ncbi:MAG: sigma-70 family RNA polymerase sigma factor, partial [Nocardiopsaceae bacterium]|nr:sigma-70 family RNA polymerase sigma factor [Nocardiopsaceae bacterium]